MATEILNYKFTSLPLTADSTGTYDATVTGVEQVTDVGAVNGFGDTANFDGATYYTMATIPATLSNDSARSGSMWIYSTVDSVLQKFYGTAPGNPSTTFSKSATNKLSLQTAGVAFTLLSTADILVNTWTHCAFTYDLTTVSIYLNGVFEDSVTSAWDLSGGNSMAYVGAGAGSFDLTGNMVDFSIYDGALTAGEITAIFTAGPDVPVVVSLTGTPYTHTVDLVWGDVATTYTVTQDDVEILTDTTNLLMTVYNLTPNTSYTYKLFLDSATTAEVTTVVTTSVLDAGATTALLTSISNDLTLLNSVTIAELDTFITSVLVHLDTVTSRLSDGTKVFTSSSIFVGDSETTTVTTGAYVLPLTTTGGASQTTTLTVPSAATEITEIVTYDETLDQITVDSVAYSVGDLFPLGDMKVSIFSIN